MDAWEARELVRENRIVLAVRGIDPELIVPAAEVFQRVGIRMLEVTFDQSDPDTLERTARSIDALKNVFGSSFRIGAGTVMSVDQVMAAKGAGAEYILSPETDAKVIEASVREGLPCIPGAMTPSEISKAWKCGAALVKVFPAASLGTGYFRSLGGPLGHVPLLPMGGINADNVGEYLAIPQVIGVGIGSAIADRKLIEKREWAILAENAARVTAAAGVQQNDNDDK
jgi:2-dehydro-3-deoxyphosphogluconate aldolase/(4S)-4-hydroxy-2-oxoglutarate aldolase